MNAFEPVPLIVAAVVGAAIAVFLLDIDAVKGAGIGVGVQIAVRLVGVS